MRALPVLLLALLLPSAVARSGGGFGGRVSVTTRAAPSVRVMTAPRLPPRVFIARSHSTAPRPAVVYHAAPLAAPVTIINTPPSSPQNIYLEQHQPLVRCDFVALRHSNTQLCSPDVISAYQGSALATAPAGQPCHYTPWWLVLLGCVILVVASVFFGYVWPRHE